MTDTISAEEIAQHYSASMDSVNLINAVIADPETYSDDETVLQRNVDHLAIMVAKDFWTTEDMAAIEAAIIAGNGYTAA
tara:strand:+ start:2892 stop:3128 length:237 start_codon:yes stop_codon:yes gene_type:complete